MGTAMGEWVHTHSNRFEVNFKTIMFDGLELTQLCLMC